MPLTPSKTFPPPNALDFRQDLCVKPDPDDSITELHFSPAANHLMTSSWDKKLRIYDIAHTPGSQPTGNMIFDKELPAPILSSDWSKDGTIVAAGTVTAPVLLDLRSDNSTHTWANAHSKAIKGIRFVYPPASNGLIIATGSWDGTLKYWDPRQKDAIASLDCGGKVYSMDAKAELLAVATSADEVRVVDLKEPGRWRERVETALKNQIRVIECMHDGKGFGVAGIEGRCAVKYLEKEKESKTFSFRCHRHEAAPPTGELPGTRRLQGLKSDMDVYSVNSLSFHPVHGTFATGSSDGSYAFWDGDSKSRLGQSIHVGMQGGIAGAKGEMPITATGFNADGRLFAYAAGYDWSQGFSRNNGTRRDWVFVRTVGKECEPKGGVKGK